MLAFIFETGLAMADPESRFKLVDSLMCHSIGKLSPFKRKDYRTPSREQRTNKNTSRPAYTQSLSSGVNLDLRF